MKRILVVENSLFFVECFFNWIDNNVANTIPSHTFRLLYYRLRRVQIGKESSIALHTNIRNPLGISIGSNCAINQNSYLDGRGGLVIGNNVNFGRYSAAYTASHDYNSQNFDYFIKSVKICDHAWVANQVIILPGVTIGEGAVVGAGSVVTKDVEPYTLVAGNPAKFIKKRNKNLKYRTKYFQPFY